MLELVLASAPAAQSTAPRVRRLGPAEIPAESARHKAAPARHWAERGRWTARWLHPPEAPAPAAGLYSLAFELKSPAAFRIHVTASALYELSLDGEELGRGPESGHDKRWHFDAYELRLAPGRHELRARVWTGRPRVFPNSRPGLREDGFLLEAQGPDAPPISTGQADWCWTPEPRVRFGRADHLTGASAPITFDFLAAPGPARRPRLGARGAGLDTVMHDDEPLLAPPLLPPLHEARWTSARVRAADHGADGAAWAAHSHPSAKEGEWRALLERGAPLRIEGQQRRRVLIDLGDYLCHHPVIHVAGGRGARLRWRCTESLFLGEKDEADAKPHRDRVDGGRAVAPADEATLDGAEHRLRAHWFRSGRYFELSVQAADAPVEIRGIAFFETRHELPEAEPFVGGPPEWQTLVRVAVRTLQNCAHWTFVDCPFYEQGQWLGDARVQALCHLVLWRDDSLVRKLLLVGAEAPRRDGVPPAFFPGLPVLRIPSFGLWWVCLLHDYARWRDDLAFVRSLLPAARAITEAALEAHRAGRAQEGWTFVDWAAGWADGEFPGSGAGHDVFHRLLLLHVLEKRAELELWLGDSAEAARCAAAADSLAAQIVDRFWRKEPGLLADAYEGPAASEHAQALGALCARIPADVRERCLAALENPEGLTRTRLFFSHNVLEAVAGAGRPFTERFAPWLSLLGRGLRTFPETEEPTRSDCHGWSAHPVYHLVTKLVGIEPVGAGFAELRIRPRPEGVRRAAARAAHPRGWVAVEWSLEGDECRFKIDLPAATRGTLEWSGGSHALREGTNALVLPNPRGT
jgi:hypothetical protein